MKFGIYPSAVTGTSNGLLRGLPDNPEAINKALDVLQGNLPSFTVRAYVHYKGDGVVANQTPLNPEQYLAPRRLLDLVLCYQTDTEDIAGWCQLITDTVKHYGSQLSSIQITEESNLKGKGMDGDSPGCLEALITGVMRAKQVINSHQLTTQVGFGTVVSMDPTDSYWQDIAVAADKDFYSALDYVGVDIFPDVFFSIAFEKLPASVSYILDIFRNQNLKTANIMPEVPIHITEHGWPTGPERTEDTQAAVIESVIQTIYHRRKELNITHYELFQLRDAISANDDLFAQFGILRDDYTPKAGFERYQKIMSELATH